MATRDLTLNIGARTKDLNAALGKMRKDVRSATGNVTALMKQAGTQMTVALTAPLAMFGRHSIKTFASFEQAMAKVKAVSGATAQEFSDLTNKAKDLGATTRFTSSQVAGLMLEYSKLGFTSEEIQKVTKATLELAQATDSDLSQSAAVAGQVLRAFGLDASETQRVVDVMAKSFSSSALDMTTFQDAMSYVAPIAKAAGMSIEETTAMLGTLHNAGIRGSKAGTALRRIFTEMIDTGLPAGDAIAVLAKKGIDLGGAMDEVGKRAMSALLVLTENKKGTDALTDALNNSEGAAADMAAIMDDTTEGAFKRMGSALEAVSISFGESFAPVANMIADVVAAMASAFSKIPSPARNMLGVLALLTAAGGPLLLLGPQILAARQALAVFKAELLATRAAALMMSPMGPVIAVAVGAVALAAYVASKRLGRMKEELSAVQKIEQKAVKAHEQEAAKLSALIETYKALGSQSENRAHYVREMQKIAPEYFGDLDAEKAKLSDLNAAFKEYNKEARQAAIQRAFGDALVEVQTQALKLEEQMLKMGMASRDMVAGVETEFGFMEIPPHLIDAYEQGTAQLMGFRDQMADLGIDTMMLSQASAMRELKGENDDLNASIARVSEAMQDNTSSTDAATYSASAAAVAQERFNEALKVAEKLKLDPDKINVGGLLGKLGEGTDDGTGLKPFHAMFTLSDEQIAEADKRTQELTEKAKQRLENFKGQVQSFGQSLAGSIAGVFNTLQQGTKSFGQVMVEILEGLLVKLASMVAAFAILSVLFPGSAGSLGGFLKAGFGIPQATPMAEGGIVSGPSHILAGEYAGARSNPEVIAPLSKLKTMMGGGSLSARVSGRDLLFISQRDNRNARRQYTSTLI